LHLNFVGPVRESDLFLAFSERMKGEATKFLKGKFSHAVGCVGVVLVKLLDSSAKDYDKHLFYSFGKPPNV
jgi:hypothetical protein